MLDNRRLIPLAALFFCSVDILPDFPNIVLNSAYDLPIRFAVFSSFWRFDKKTFRTLIPDELPDFEPREYC